MKQLLFSISYVPRDGESTLDEIEELGDRICLKGEEIAFLKIERSSRQKGVN